MGRRNSLASSVTALGQTRAMGFVRFLALFAFALVAFAIVLLAAGKNPTKAYADIFMSTLGSSYGFSEVLVKMIPLVLTAVAVALPFRIGLINLGAEGQLYMGAWAAAWGALTFHGLPKWVLLPVMFVLGFLGGGVWACIPGILRAKGLVDETISTLLLNYVAVLVVNFSVFGPWRDPASGNYPQSPFFPDAGRLPRFGDTRVHLGIVFALAAVSLFYFVLARTRWGLEMRAIGGNAGAARRSGISVDWYIVIVLLIGGGIAGLAGMSESSAIQARLSPGLSPGYGWMGFLITWLAGASPMGILAMAFLLAVITAGGDILQITQGLPFSVVNILLALILFVVVGRGRGRTGAR